MNATHEWDLYNINFCTIVIFMIWIQHNWLKVVAIIMLGGSIAPIPYFAFYQMMNWVVVLASALVVLDSHQKNSVVLLWTFVFVGVLFNPLAPFYLRTDIWHIADIVVIMLFLLSFVALRNPQQQ